MELILSEENPIPLSELLEEFEFLGDWEDQCDFLIDLGFRLPPLPEEAKVEENRVHGCQSNVWLVANIDVSVPPILTFVANSDAIIVNGLISVLMSIYSGKTADNVLATDAQKIFAQLGLDRQLSSQRRNGLFGMVKRIRQIAAASTAHN